MKSLCSLLSLIILLAACSHSPQADRSFERWQVMTVNAGKKDMLCYAGTAPVQSTGTAQNRSQPYLMATRRPSGKIEISVSSGYAYKIGSKLALVIGHDTHRLYFKDSVGWAKSDAEDKAIIAALKTSPTAQVLGLSQADTTSIDTYSNDGFSAALKRIRELCP